MDQNHSKPMAGGTPPDVGEKDMRVHRQRQTKATAWVAPGELTMLPTGWVATTDALLRKTRMKWFGTKRHLPLGSSLGLY